MTVAPPPVDISTLLCVKPSPSGGRLCVTGTGISVRAISCLYNQGLTPTEILENYDSLDLPGVHAAIAHYLANKERMDAELEEDRRQSETDRAFYEQHGRLPDES